MTAEALDRLRAEIARCPYHDFLRPEAVDVASGIVVVRLPYRPEFGLAREGYAFHGGVLAALVDITGHAAIALEVGHVSPTIDLRIDYLAAALGTELIASGRVLQAGGSIARADVEVRDRRGSVVVTGRGTFSTRRRTPDSNEEATACAP
jgi:uncharacterized protein (TIGR00369 family)